MKLLIGIITAALFLIIGVLLSILSDYIAKSPRLKKHIRPFANMVCWSHYKILKALDSLYKRGGIFSILSIIIILLTLGIGLIHIVLSLYLERFSDYEYQKIKVHGNLGEATTASLALSFLLCIIMYIFTQ